MTSAGAKSKDSSSGGVGGGKSGGRERLAMTIVVLKLLLQITSIEVLGAMAYARASRGRSNTNRFTQDLRR